MKSFEEALQTGEFVVTAECGPPKGVDIGEMVENIRLLKGRVHAVNATDNQASVMRISSLAVCRIILDNGLEPIFQMTCRDRNRLALQSDLLGAYVLGIKNVLALTGDHVCAGDHKSAKPVFDLDSVHMLHMIESLNSGRDMGGNELSGTPRFFAGASVTPEAKPLAPQLMKFRKKLKGGARFFQTQAIYDVSSFKEFMNVAHGLSAKVIAGILLLKSPGMAKFLNNNVPGITVPEELIDELREAGKGNYIQAGIEIAARTIKQVKDSCEGVHIMAIGAEDLVPEILDKAGL